MNKSYQSDMDIPSPVEKTPYELDMEYRQGRDNYSKASDYLPAKRTLKADFGRPIILLPGEIHKMTKNQKQNMMEESSKIKDKY